MRKDSKTEHGYEIRTRDGNKSNRQGGSGVCTRRVLHGVIRMRDAAVVNNSEGKMREQQSKSRQGGMAQSQSMARQRA